MAEAHYIGNNAGTGQTALPARPYIVLTLLILTSSLMTMSADLYAPSLPHLPDYFGTNEETVKLTMSLWFMAYGSLVLIYGPLSDRFGRRPVLAGAMAAYTVFTFFCIVAQNIEQLLAARILQGAMAGAEGVLVISIITDCFSEKGQVRAFSIYRGICAIPPILAPILGAYVYLRFGWQANFILLFAISACVTALLWKYLKESQHDRNPTSVRILLSDYWRLVTSIRFLSLAVIMSTAIAYLVVFSATVPFILTNVLDMPTEAFGYFQAGTMLAFILGSVAAGRLVDRLGTSQLLLFGIALVALGSVILLFTVFSGTLTLATFALSMSLISFGNGPVLSTVPPLAINATTSPTGASAAMLLTVTSYLASSTSVVEGMFSNGTAMSLAVIMGGVSVIALVSYFVAIKLVGTGEKA